MKQKNDLFPIFLKLSALKTLIVGGGNVALEKLQSILTNSPTAQIKLVAPHIKAEIIDFKNNFQGLTLINRKFDESDIDEMDLIICATDNPELHKKIKLLAAHHHTLVNVADTPDLCDFYLSSIVQKGNLKIGISTNGLSPTGAKRIKEMLSEAIPDEIDIVLNELHQIRNNLKGDFAYKINKMSELTKVLSWKNSVVKRKWWTERLAWVLAIIIAFLLGYFIR